MTDAITDHAPDTHSDWPLRPWALAMLLALAGLGVHFVAEWDASQWQPSRAALTAALAFGPLAFAFTLGRDRWKEPLAFAVVVALVMGGIAWRVANAGDRHVDGPFWFAAGVIAIALALPLFQAGFHRLRWRTPYDETHFHVWTDAISAAGALAFTGLAWVLLFLLAQLFAAIEIDLLKNLIDDEWFGWAFSGAAFGAALGVLRNQLKIIGTLQSVVMLVFSIIAVPLALALAIFLVAVLASGIAVLWNATESPTPLLLSVAAASFVLVNAVVRNGEEEASRNRVLCWSALALALAIFPLALLAAISTGTRISEYGLSPERLWGIVAVAVAVAYGLAYFIAPIRGRIAGWMARVRTANLHLAVGTCVLAFILALPLFDFGAISAKNQIARLEAGKVAVNEFDFAALRWDFGDAGREALAQLARSEDKEISRLALEASKQKMRPYRYREDGARTSEDQRLANLRTDIPDGALLNEARAIITLNPWRCEKTCVVLDLGPEKLGGRHIGIVEAGNVEIMLIDLNDGTDGYATRLPSDRGLAETRGNQTPDSTVEIREWNGRRIYIDGKPAGAPFE